MEALKDAGIVVGLILSIISVIGVIYSVAVKSTKVNAVIDGCKTCSESTPKEILGLKGQLTGLQTKMDLVWQLQTAEVLERQRLAVQMASRPEDHLADHQSPYKLTPNGENCLSDVLFILDDLRGIDALTASDIPKFVVERIGMDKLDSIARQKGCTPSEILAAITVKLGLGI